MKTLHLTLKKKWFDMIVFGEKKEEYREFKPYWHRRLANREYDQVKFRNGYSKNSPTITVEFKNIGYGLGNVEHGAPMNEGVYIIKLGNIISTENIKNV